MPAMFLSQILVASALVSPVAIPSDMRPPVRPPVTLVAGTSASSALAGTEWLLKTLAGGTVDPEIGSSLGFDDEGNTHGNGGCNRFRGGVTVKGEALKFGNLASTMMACEENASRQEFAFHTALGKTASFRIDSGDLVLLDDKGEVLAQLTPSK